VPIAAHAVWRGARLELRAAVGNPERLEQPLLRAEAGDAIDDAAGAEALGVQVARSLLDQGRAGYLGATASADTAPTPPERSASAAPDRHPASCQAESWVAQLVARGIDAVAVPLIEIAAPADPQPVEAAWHGIAAPRRRRLRQRQRGDALLRRAAGRRRLAAEPARRGARPGHGGSLRTEGVPATAIVAPAADAAQLDSESLWRELQARDWRGRSVLVVRGDGGRDWLIERLVENGAASMPSPRTVASRRVCRPGRGTTSTPRSRRRRATRGSSAARRRSAISRRWTASRSGPVRAPSRRIRASRRGRDRPASPR
jgi:hypothetical protein